MDAPFVHPDDVPTVHPDHAGARLLRWRGRALLACLATGLVVGLVDRSELPRTIRSLCSNSRDAFVLVKGSRALELERLVEELVNDAG